MPICVWQAPKVTFLRVTVRESTEWAMLSRPHKHNEREKADPQIWGWDWKRRPYGRLTETQAPYRLLASSTFRWALENICISLITDAITSRRDFLGNPFRYAWGVLINDYSLVLGGKLCRTWRRRYLANACWPLLALWGLTSIWVDGIGTWSAN